MAPDPVAFVALCGETAADSTSRTSDITDAHVVICAARAGQAVVTSDPDDLRALDPGLALVTL
jgi:hypothetical protein